MKNIVWLLSERLAVHDTEAFVQRHEEVPETLLTIHTEEVRDVLHEDTSTLAPSRDDQQERDKRLESHESTQIHSLLPAESRANSWQTQESNTFRENNKPRAEGAGFVVCSQKKPNLSNKFVICTLTCYYPRSKSRNFDVLQHNQKGKTHATIDF